MLAHPALDLARDRRVHVQRQAALQALAVEGKPEAAGFGVDPLDLLRCDQHGPMAQPAGGVDDQIADPRIPVVEEQIFDRADSAVGGDDGEATEILQAVRHRTSFHAGCGAPASPCPCHGFRGAGGGTRAVGGRCPTTPT